MNNEQNPQLTIPRVKHWLLTRKWLWKKVVFDNGIVGKNYHRYDHRIYSYSQGMGNNGESGNVNTAIKWQIEALHRACA